MANKVTSQDIIKLLAARHDKDVFVPEAKTGSSWAGCRRIDAWVMKRSWSPVTMIGYEIKVGRSDFLRDDKWQEYLAYCHEFSFVCPPGLIKPEELPAGIGLIYTTKSGARLYTKRKAVRREIEPNCDLLTYVLMSRTHIVGDMHEANSKQLGAKERWRQWLEARGDREDLGREVRGKIAKLWHKGNDENDELRSQHKVYENIRQRIKELGFDPGQHIYEWQIHNKLAELCRRMPDGFKYRIVRLQDELGELHDILLADEERGKKAAG